MPQLSNQPSFARPPKPHHLHFPQLPFQRAEPRDARPSFPNAKNPQLPMSSSGGRTRESRPKSKSATIPLMLEVAARTTTQATRV